MGICPILPRRRRRLQEDRRGDEASIVREKEYNSQSAQPKAGAHYSLLCVCARCALHNCGSLAHAFFWQPPPWKGLSPQRAFPPRDVSKAA